MTKPQILLPTRLNPFFFGGLATILLVAPMKWQWLVPLLFFAPLPFYFLALGRGFQETLLAVGILFAAAALLSHELYFPLMALLVFGAFPLITAYLLTMGWRAGEITVLAFLIGAALLALLLFGAWLFHVDLHAILVDHLTLYKNDTITKFSTLEGVGPVQIVELKAALDQIIRLLSWSIPAIAFSSWFVLHAGNLLLASLHLRTPSGIPLGTGDISSLHLPFVLIWPLIAFALMAYFASPTWQFIGINLGLYLVQPYAIQGIAIFQTLFQHFKTSRVLRGIFYTLLLIWSDLLILITLIGLFDIWFDFRARILGTPPNTSDPSSGRT